MTARPTPSPREASSAASAARKMRADRLASVLWKDNPEYEGYEPYALSVHDVIEEAARPEGRPLRRIRLRDLLLAQHGWGPARADRVVARLLDVSGSAVPAHGTTIGWLLDGRVRGDRWLAWCDVYASETRRHEAPWDGWPMTPPPEDLAAILRCGHVEAYDDLTGGSS